MVMIATLDIEVFNPEKVEWAQAKYLVHGHEDVSWTNNLDEALSFLKEQILLIEKEFEK